MYTCSYMYIGTPTGCFSKAKLFFQCTNGAPLRHEQIGTGETGTWPNGYLVFFLASTSGIYLNSSVLRCMFPWRARYPVS